MKLLTPFLITFLLVTATRVVNAQYSPVLNKEQTKTLYNQLYASSTLPSMPWKGDVQSCNAGGIDTSVYRKAENRINFFRLVNGLHEVKNNPSLNYDTQQAAFLCKVNNQLTHTPSNTMKCYSTNAYSGCSKSCLAFLDFVNFPKTSFITGMIQDYGESNFYIGHRRWLLYSRLSEFGYGATDRTEAIRTTDGTKKITPKPPVFVAYPWNGFVPVDLIFPKWSFSIAESKKPDFSKATVKMYDSNGKEIALKVLQQYKFLDPTLVWEVTGMFTANEIYYSQNKLEEKGYLDKKIDVQIKNVIVNGKSVDFSYSVEPFKP